MQLPRAVGAGCRASAAGVKDVITTTLLAIAHNPCPAFTRSRFDRLWSP